MKNTKQKNVRIECDNAMLNTRHRNDISMVSFQRFDSFLNFVKCYNHWELEVELGFSPAEVIRKYKVFN